MLALFINATDADSQAQNRSDHEHVFMTNTLYLFIF